jgi:cell fate (sporulation/competence/biofilm development) regulator YlbF (YheA/YmcA/DUF963 family)
MKWEDILKYDETRIREARFLVRTYNSHEYVERLFRNVTPANFENIIMEEIKEITEMKERLNPDKESPSNQRFTEYIEVLESLLE